MSSLTIQTDELIALIRLHLNNAQASLENLKIKYAKLGLLSAASVQTLAELALRHRTELHGREPDTFEEFLREGLALTQAYWDSFGLVVINGPQQVPVVVQRVKPVEPTKPILDRRTRAYKAVPETVRAAIENDLMLGKPANCDTIAEWLQKIADKHGVSEGSVSRYYYTKSEKKAQ